MKTLAQRNSIYELVIVVKRGICTELIWVSDKNLTNRLSSVVYDKQMGFMNQFDRTYLIEVLHIDCKIFGLKKDCTSERFMINTAKMKQWLDINLAPDRLFDIEAILNSAEFKPRTIILASTKSGRECLIKVSKFNEKVAHTLVNAGYKLLNSCKFTTNEGLRLFAFMVPSTTSDIVDYEIGQQTVKRFKLLLESQGITE